VKYILVFFTLVLSFAAIQVNAQNENWDTYLAKFDDKQGSVLVDMELINKAPDSKLPFLVITGPHAQICNKKGMPAADEMNTLEEILNATDNFLTGVTAKTLAGTFTFNCNRLNYYYVRDTANVRNAIGRMYRRSFSGYKYTLNIKYDPDWISYRTFLYPTDETKAWMDNSKVIAALRASGDSLTQKRDIKFVYRFSTDTAREAFLSIAQSKGYKTDIARKTAAEQHIFEIMVYKSDFVKMKVIEAATADLNKEAKIHKGILIGWDAKL
jgi:hypothetical protein